jgi:hypothetical protein
MYNKLLFEYLDLAILSVKKFILQAVGYDNVEHDHDAV